MGFFFFVLLRLLFKHKVNKIYKYSSEWSYKCWEKQGKDTLLYLGELWDICLHRWPMGKNYCWLWLHRFLQIQWWLILIKVCNNKFKYHRSVEKKLSTFLIRFFATHPCGFPLIILRNGFSSLPNFCPSCSTISFLSFPKFLCWCIWGAGFE